VKSSKTQTHSRVHKIPTVRFDDERLTSFSGLIIFQAFFQKLRLKQKVTRCFAHIKTSRIYGLPTIFLHIVVHLIMGFERLRDSEYSHQDPIVCRILGVRRIPTPATISRSLTNADTQSVHNVRTLSRQITLDRLKAERLSRVTADFDGSVFMTRGQAEGSAVGYCKRKKGARSYYPLFCTIAQTQQFLDRLHRPGNVHDSNGAAQFIKDCFAQIRHTVPTAILESRMDSAFFNDDIILQLDQEGIEFTASVPFERFTDLKTIIENRKRWRRLDQTWSYFETQWKPKCWQHQFRFIFIRQKVKVKHKGPIQLDLFIPYDHDFEYKVIVTNKICCAKKVLKFHNGRGSQEGIFGEAKTDVHLEYIPTRRLIGNQLYTLAAMLAHNLTKELQILSQPRVRGTTEKRSPLWKFTSLGTLRHRLIQRAGRLTKPEGKLTLTMSANRRSQSEFLSLLDAVRRVA
jgi:hypothetical protein